MYRSRVRLVNPAQIFLLVFAVGCEEPAPLGDICATVRRAPVNMRAIEIANDGQLTEHGPCRSGNCRWAFGSAVLRRAGDDLVLERPGVSPKRFPYIEAPFVKPHGLALIRAGKKRWTLLNARDWSEKTLNVDRRHHELFSLATDTGGAVLVTGMVNGGPLRQARVDDDDLLFRDHVELAPGVSVVTTGTREVIWPDGARESLNEVGDLMFASALGERTVVVTNADHHVFSKERGKPLARIPIQNSEHLKISEVISFIRAGERIDRLRGSTRTPWVDERHHVDGSTMPPSSRRRDLRLVSTSTLDHAFLIEQIELESCANLARVYRTRGERVSFVLEASGRMLRPVLDQHGILHAVLGDDRFTSL